MSLRDSESAMARDIMFLVSDFAALAVILQSFNSLCLKNGFWFQIALHCMSFQRIYSLRPPGRDMMNDIPLCTLFSSHWYRTRA